MCTSLVVPRNNIDVERNETSWTFIISKAQLSHTGRYTCGTQDLYIEVSGKLIYHLWGSHTIAARLSRQ